MICFLSKTFTGLQNISNFVFLSNFLENLFEKSLLLCYYKYIHYILCYFFKHLQCCIITNVLICIKTFINFRTLITCISFFITSFSWFVHLFHCNYYCLHSVYAPCTCRYPPRVEDAGLPGIWVTVGSVSPLIWVVRTKSGFSGMTKVGAKNKISVLLNDSLLITSYIVANIFLAKWVTCAYGPRTWRSKAESEVQTQTMLCVKLALS